MAYTIKIGTISKHEESTKQPNMTGWTEYSVVFKDGADIVNPTITISADLSTLSGCNYAYMLGRYYWIRDISVLRTGYCILDLETDVLATYKSQIGGSSLYILRSASSYDGSIPDNWYPPKASPTIYVDFQDLATVPYVNFNTGFYLLSVMGRGNSAGGAEFIYSLEPSEFKQLIEEVFFAVNGLQLTDAWNGVSQLFGGNPQQLISGAVWVPWEFPGTSAAVILGGYTSNVVGKMVSKATMDLASFSYSVRKHPKATTKGKYLNMSPYSSYQIDLNSAGIVELDSSKLIDETTIYVNRTLDVKGQLLNTVIGGSGYEYAKIYGQMGVPISLNGNNSMGTTITSVVSAIGATAAAAATGGLAVVGAVAAGVGNIASAVGGSFSNTSVGSVAGIGEPGRLITTFYDIPDEDNTRNGRPYCKVAQPSSLSGFMIAQRGDVDIPGTIGEQQKIKMFLESGFFYE